MLKCQGHYNDEKGMFFYSGTQNLETELVNTIYTENLPYVRYYRSAL